MSPKSSQRHIILGRSTIKNEKQKNTRSRRSNSKENSEGIYSM